MDGAPHLRLLGRCPVLGNPRQRIPGVGPIAGSMNLTHTPVQRETGLSYKSALFLMHRIRFAMARDPRPPKLRGTVEIHRVD